MNPTPTIYTTGGTVQAGDGIYLSRKADDELLQLCREGQFAYVLTPRQMGKSSLMVQTALRLEEEGITSVIIDLTKIGTAVTAEQWYLGLLTEMDEVLMFDTDIFEWWETHNKLGVTQRLTKFFEAVLLEEVDGQIAVFVDEIDTTLSLGFTDDFFIAIRYFYTARAQKEDFGRLSFVLIGVASPGNLIRDPQRTPFNVGQRVRLTNFTKEEAAGFASGFGLPKSESNLLLDQILDWTSGHPYLTQQLCQAVVSSHCEVRDSKAVDRIARQLFLNSGTDFSDSNLQFVRDMLIQRAPSNNVDNVLKVYRDIWERKRVVIDEEQSLVKSHLKLSGIVRRDPLKKTLSVSNKIYRQVFDLEWVKEHLSKYGNNQLRRVKIALAISFVATAATVPLSVYAFIQQQESQKELQELRTIRNVHQRASPAAVRIVIGCKGAFRFFSPRGSESDFVSDVSYIMTSSSGFFVNPEGYIATNARIDEGNATGDHNGTCKEKLFENFVEQIESMMSHEQGYYSNDPTALDFFRRNSRLIEEDFESVNEVILDNGRKYNFSLLAVGDASKNVISGNDIAIIKINVQNAPSLRLAEKESIELGSEVVVMGYPSSSNAVLLRDAVIRASSILSDVSSMKQTVDNRPIIQIDGSMSEGMIGGPILNSNNEVVGLTISSGSNLSGVISIPNAIPSSTLIEFLESIGIENKIGIASSRYLEGLEQFWVRDYRQAKLNFEQVKRLFEDYPNVDELIREANIAIVAEQTNNQKGYPALPLHWPLLGAVIGLAGIAITGTILRKQFLRQ